MAQPQMPTFLDIQVQGLYLNPSTFGSNAPPGALTVADNVVIDRPSVVATRRGFDNSFATFIDASLSSLFQYNNIQLAYTTDKILSADPLNNGVFVNYAGLYDVPDPNNPASRIRAIEANKNFYFITLNGTYRLDHVAGQPRLAGAPPGLSGTGEPVDASGWFPDQTNVAYRVVFGYRDFNKQLVLGAPSSQIIVTNDTGHSANVSLTFQVPKEIQAAPTDYFFQVYRSDTTPNLISAPGDEMALVYEDITTGQPTQTIHDITPSNLRGAVLYTSPSQYVPYQSGQGSENFRPPWAMDIALYKQYTFYANTRTIQTSSLTLVSAGASNDPLALQPPQTITFTSSNPTKGSFTLTADTVNDFASGHFAVSDTGEPGFDIQVTAANIALVTNAYPANTFIAAYYTSTANDLPGKLSFTELVLSTDTFTITTSNPGAQAFEQPFPVVSTNDVAPNRIYFSKFNQPEAVPPLNYFDVGSANQPINRIIPLRDGLMVLKQDGVFRISDATPPFTKTAIDYNIRILADNTAAELDNQVYFLSDQGVVALSDTDGKIMSFVLDKTIIENTSPNLYPNLQATAWGISYQSARKYILCMPTINAGQVSSTDTQATQQYVYNHLTQVWTRWTLDVSCGIVLRSDGKLYLGSATAADGITGSAPGVNNNYLYRERKSFTLDDYADNQYTTTITQIIPLAALPDFGTTIIINNPALPPGKQLTVGWTVTDNNPNLQSSARIIKIEVASPTTTRLTLDRGQFWSLLDSIIIYEPIVSTVQTIQLDCQNPGMNKQFSEIVYIFMEQGFSTLTTAITSDNSNSPAVDILLPQSRGGWGYDPWGLVPWGGKSLVQGKVRRYIPQTMQRMGWIYVNIVNAEAFTSFGWAGCQLFYKQTSSRQT